MGIRVLDIYRGNRVDIAYEKATGIDAVIFKGGQGAYQDMRWNNWHIIDECRDADMPYGVYWVRDARIDPVAEKAAIKESFPDGNFGQLGFFLDVEKPVISMKEADYNRLPFAHYKPIESVLQSMQAFSKTGVGIYTSPGQWALCAGNVPELKQEWFAEFPLWSAQYAPSPQLYGKWTEIKMWQFRESPDWSMVLDPLWFYGKVEPPKWVRQIGRPR